MIDEKLLNESQKLHNDLLKEQIEEQKLNNDLLKERIENQKLQNKSLIKE